MLIIVYKRWNLNFHEVQERCFYQAMERSDWRSDVNIPSQYDDKYKWSAKYNINFWIIEFRLNADFTPQYGYVHLGLMKRILCCA